jgi:hypothetical protein
MNLEGMLSSDAVQAVKPSKRTPKKLTRTKQNDRVRADQGLRLVHDFTVPLARSTKADREAARDSGWNRLWDSVWDKCNELSTDEEVWTPEMIQDEQAGAIVFEIRLDVEDETILKFRYAVAANGIVRRETTHDFMGLRTALKEHVIGYTRRGSEIHLNLDLANYVWDLFADCFNTP